MTQYFILPGDIINLVLPFSLLSSVYYSGSPEVSIIITNWNMPRPDDEPPAPIYQYIIMVKKEKRIRSIVENSNDNATVTKYELENHLENSVERFNIL